MGSRELMLRRPFRLALDRPVPLLELIESRENRVVAVIQLGISDAEGRQQVDDLAKRAKKHAVVHGDLLELGAGWIEVPAGSINNEIKGGHCSGEAWVLHPGMTGEFFQAWTMPRFESLEISGISLQKIQARVGGSASQRVGGEAVTVPKREAWVIPDEGFEHRLTGHGHPHRQAAAGESLGQGHQVRADPGPSAGEPIATSSEAC